MTITIGEIENYEGLIVEKSGMEPDRVAQFIDLLFQYVEVVPADDFYPAIEKANATIGDTDPDDVLYLGWRSPAMRPSGAMIPTSTNRTSLRRTRRVA
jgi:predicted nucleic acid-binding protein